MNAVVKDERGIPHQLPAVAEPTNLLAVIERAATNPDVDVDKMERLMAMARQLQGDRAKAQFNAALALVQAETRSIGADATNPQTRSKYATYPKLDKVLRPIYTGHGFSLSFDTGQNAPAEMVEVLGYLAHRDGHTHTYRALMPADGKGAKGNDVMTKTHAAGAAMSYGMRYILKMAFNIAVGEDDTDGNNDAQTIGPGQCADLVALQDEVGADKPRFLSHFGIDKLDDLPCSRYLEAVRMLEAKRRK